VVVDDLDVFRAGRGPAEADPPLLVDPNAVGRGAVAFELLEPVPWRDSEVAQGIGSIKDQEFPQSDPLGVRIQLADSLPLPDTFGVFVSEGPQHSLSITGSVSNVKR